MDARDDIYEYSLDTHHSEEAGQKMRKKFYFVLALLSAITIIEVAMGMIWMTDLIDWFFDTSDKVAVAPVYALFILSHAACFRPSSAD